MNKRKLRRVAIVALVLVLLCNTLGVQAETGAPAVTVSSYEELVNAIDQASNLDTIRKRQIMRVHLKSTPPL